MHGDSNVWRRKRMATELRHGAMKCKAKSSRRRKTHGDLNRWRSKQYRIQIRMATNGSNAMKGQFKVQCAMDEYLLSRSYKCRQDSDCELDTCRTCVSICLSGCPLVMTKCAANSAAEASNSARADSPTTFVFVNRRPCDCRH